MRVLISIASMFLNWVTLQPQNELNGLSEMSETAGIFTPRAWLIPLGNLFGDLESLSEQSLVSFVSFDLEEGAIFLGRTTN